MERKQKYLLPIAVLEWGSRQRFEMIIMDINGLKEIHLPFSIKITNTLL